MTTDEKPLRIDAHHHFWKYTVKEYGWIDDTMDVIRRDFLPEHLRADIATAGVDSVVSVQARQSEQETAWLLGLAENNAFIKGVVGWVPLASPKVDRALEKHCRHWKLRGVRHVVQGEPDDRFILGEEFNAGIRLLREFGLVYDILILERQLPATIEFADLHPEQVFVLDHIAKPKIKTGELEPWRANLIELGKRQNVYCKISGLVTEADFTAWTEAQLQPYLDTVLEAFGPQRLMFGSDWPVCRVACDYKRWVELVGRFIAKLSADEQARIMGGTAIEAYGLK
jgi:L-fuconolactonase